MGGFITNRAVRQDHPVTGDDLDGDGTVRDGVLERWVDVVAVRRRPLGGERDLAVDVWCDVQLEDPATGEPGELDFAVRDELISIGHAARHYN